MRTITRLFCAIGWPLLMCGCQSFSTLPVTVQCQPPPPGGVVHAAPRARLDPAHAQRIIGITDDGDNALIALRACQAYVRAVAR